MPAAQLVVPGDDELALRPARRWLRRLGVIAIVGALVGAIVLRRATIADALAQIGKLPLLAVAGLVSLAAYERWSRADITARLLGSVRTRDGFVVHDVGNAVSKGVPMGGALGTALRWSIVRDRDISAARFSTMLIAYGVATTFVTWLLPALALGVDLVGRKMTATDGLLMLVLGLGLLGQVGFWYVVLGSDRVERWSARIAGGACSKIARRLPGLEDADAGSVVVEVRRDLRAEARRAVPLLLRTGLAQACGAIILLVALRSLGVGSELGATEFFRVFFITHLLGTFAPTPGGVGVVEAGLSGALVAAGVDPTTALAGVLVYRFLTYVLPILTGTVLYLVWRRQRSRGPALTASDAADGVDGVDGVEGVDSASGGELEEAAETAGPLPPTRSDSDDATTLSVHGTLLDAALPDVPRTADQGVRGGRDAGGDDVARFVGRRWSPERTAERRAHPVQGEPLALAADA